ncbi:AlpA family transcriptional regulator [Solemya velum gill symbiont]|uniref:helix-turn-helix transcriptional regulator n=1 Tax=Solemya velum gill symbiont TaxID=2340 RepID=UPI0009971F50|nr:AlpA family phage regulatory protein [Solemya velum gill symbiont]OOZ75428.1 AlpA family transcriptional regulator [Solemya velum gill symbiont]
MTETITIPETGYLRLYQIIGDKKRNIPALIPISRTSWLEGVKSGRFPKPVKLTERTTAWRAEDIHKLIKMISEGEERWNDF